MPLPAYLTEQISPTDAIKSQLARLGIEIALVRNGRTVTVRSFDADVDAKDNVRRGIRLLNRFADAQQVAADIRLHSVAETFIPLFQGAGYIIHSERNDDEADAGYTLLHRAVGR